METSKASRLSWKHVICCVLLLVLFVFTIGVHINAEGYGDSKVAESTADGVPLRSNLNGNIKDINSVIKNEVELAGPKEEVTVDLREIDDYITEYTDTINFFAKTFGVKYEDIVNDLHIRYDSNEYKLVENNIGYLKDQDGVFKHYSNSKYGLVEYFYDYIEKNPKKVSKKRIEYLGDSKYVENLIVFYTTQIYTNVDTSIALSIGAAESGYYKVKYMLRCNNVFGGMNSNGLIKYKNIEYGVLSYVRMLSRRYFGKGLDSINEIGYVYCPTKDSFGNKIASPHWINLVNTAMVKYKNTKLNISIDDLYKKEVIA